MATAIAIENNAGLMADLLLLRGLESISLELTNKCNLSCVHCYASSSPLQPLYEHMSHEGWVGVLREALALGAKTVRFIGGEPVAYPRLADLMRVAKALGYKNIFLHTNGTHFSESLRATMLECGVGVAFSLYAAHAEVHDAITQVKGSFERTLNSLRWVIQSRLRVQVSITRIADAAEVDATVALVRGMGVRVVSIDRVRRIGRGGEGAPQENVKELCGNCWRGKLTIAPTGEIYPCVFSHFHRVGSVSEGLRPALRGPALRDFRNEVYSMSHDVSEMQLSSNCDPEVDPGPCNPDQDPGPCNPEQDPGPCNPDQDPGPCNPEQDPGPCNPESDPG
jgi:MoaA/NifB/PqqE/SkfB family radical SAM enzyme